MALLYHIAHIMTTIACNLLSCDCVYYHVPFDLPSLFFGKVRSLVGRGVGQISSTPPVPRSVLSGAYHHYGNPLIRAPSCARVLQQTATDSPDGTTPVGSRVDQSRGGVRAICLSDRQPRWMMGWVSSRPRTSWGHWVMWCMDFGNSIVDVPVC